MRLTQSHRERADLVIVGFRHGTHIGGSLARAAEQLRLEYVLVDAEEAFKAPRVLRIATWRLGGHRPPYLRRLSRNVAAICAHHRPRWLITTGMAPVDASTLAAIGQLGVQRLVYLTDDPWNPAFRAGWFFDALQEYDHVFSPRRANLADLAAHGCRRVSYLPFGYDPALAFHEEPSTRQERVQYATDLAFVGGADPDRIPFVDAAIRASVDVALYGGYWDRYPQTRRHARGRADVSTVRKATSSARVSLCLVRRANRDGHVMRSLEIPAMGGCMLVEDTEEHHALLGAPGQAVTYFRGVVEMVERLQWLLSAQEERTRLAECAQQRIHDGRHTYADRLQTMLGL
jgi:spore maturation protein CgeB